MTKKKPKDRFLLKMKESKKITPKRSIMINSIVKAIQWSHDYYHEKYDYWDLAEKAVDAMEEELAKL